MSAAFNWKTYKPNLDVVYAAGLRLTNETYRRWMDGLTPFVSDPERGKEALRRIAYIETNLITDGE